jgi:NADPH:quinone reductase-like Zn-dependent oxidoreductase
VTVKPAPVSYGTDLLDRISALIARGTLKPVVGAVYPFGHTIEAYQQVMTGHARGKIVLDLAR